MENFHAHRYALKIGLLCAFTALFVGESLLPYLTDDVVAVVMEHQDPVESDTEKEGENKEKEREDEIRSTYRFSPARSKLSIYKPLHISYFKSLHHPEVFTPPPEWI